MKKIIVTTTINKPTEAIKKYARMKGWELIVVGDLKTPHEAYEGYDYLTPEWQKTHYPQLSRALGWNCIQRRNIGIVEAYTRGADIIATVDDDNIPYDTWGQNVVLGEEITVRYYKTHQEVFDPLSVTEYPMLWHRGFPIELLSEKNFIDDAGETRITPYVQADLWNGAPDVDAICRIVYQPECMFTYQGKYTSNVMMPFNSQNTFIHRKVIPDYFLYPQIGRMDDIWAAYHLQKKYGNCVVFSEASVYQERNPHNVAHDLQAEQIGYEHTLNFIHGNHTLDHMDHIYKLYLEALQ